MVVCILLYMQPSSEFTAECRDDDTSLQWESIEVAADMLNGDLKRLVFKKFLCYATKVLGVQYGAASPLNIR